MAPEDLGVDVEGRRRKRSATASTSGGATNKKTAFGSTKRRISQGHAMRSIFGRERVTQTVRPWRSRDGSMLAGTIGMSASAHALVPPARTSAEAPSWRSQAAAPSLSFFPFWQATTTARPANSFAHSAAVVPPRRTDPGTSRGSLSKSLSVRTSTMTGHLGVPIRRASLSMEMVLIDDMARPRCGKPGTRCFGMSPRGEIAIPMRGIECLQAVVSSSTIEKPPGMRWQRSRTRCSSRPPAPGSGR